MQHVTDGDRQRFEKARRHGRRYALRQDAVVATRYDAQRDSLELMLRGGDVRVVPRTRIRELDASQRGASVR